MARLESDPSLDLTASGKTQKNRKSKQNALPIKLPYQATPNDGYIAAINSNS